MVYETYVYIHVMKGKNCVTQYSGLKDKILTLMDNLYSVLSFGNESCTIKWRLLYMLCMFHRQFCQIYIEFIMKNIDFEFFITKTHN